MTTLAFVPACSRCWSPRASARGQPRDRLGHRGGQTLSLLLTLVATPVFYSLFDDLSTRVTPRLWLARLFGRAPVAAHSLTGGSDS